MLDVYSPEQDFTAWLTESLKRIRTSLKMETGIASLIQNNDYKIIAVDSELADTFYPGMSFQLEDTYCKQVCENKSPVSYTHVGNITSMLDHPVYLAVKLESYIAVPLLDTLGKVVGTLNFTSLSPRVDGFTEQDFTVLTELAEQVRSRINQYIAA